MNCTRTFPTLPFDWVNRLLIKDHPLLQLFAHILENVCSHLSLADVAKLASCCTCLRPLMHNTEGVYYILQYIRPMNSQQTKRTFLLPRSTKLLKLSRARYSQSEAFALAIHKYQNLTHFRHVANLRALSRQKRAVLMLLQVERANMLRYALVQLHLPTCLAFTSREGIHFRIHCRQCPDALLDILLSNCVEGICFRWFLLHHTDYRTRLDAHIATFGHYEGAAAIVASEYERPDVWPWLQFIFPTV